MNDEILPQKQQKAVLETRHKEYTKRMNDTKSEIDKVK